MKENQYIHQYKKKCNTYLRLKNIKEQSFQVSSASIKNSRHYRYRSCALLKTHANGRNKSQHCCVLLANNVASVFMGLKVRPVSNYTQQVPKLLWLCKRTQHVGPNNVGCCWPTMLRPFARAFMNGLSCRTEVQMLSFRN